MSGDRWRERNPVRLDLAKGRQIQNREGVSLHRFDGGCVGNEIRLEQVDPFVRVQGVVSEVEAEKEIDVREIDGSERWIERSQARHTSIPVTAWPLPFNIFPR